MNRQKELFYKLLNDYFPPVIARGSISAYLFFDDMTICPKEGRKVMASVKALTEKEAHQAFTNPKIGAILQRLNEHNSKLSIIERTIVQRLALSYQRASALPAEFVERKDMIISAANQAWVEARKNNDSAAFMPHFKKVLAVTRETAVYFGADPDNLQTQYDFLLEKYEPEMPPQNLDQIVQKIIKWVVPFLQRIQASETKLDDQPLHGHFNLDRQHSLARAITTRMGYDYSKGHLALTTHPFMATLAKGDHRITMRIDPGFLSSCLFAVMHETGHALYEQSADDLIHQAAVPGLLYSMGIHESSSRLWENMVGRSQPFLEFAYPTIQTLFEQFYDIPLNRFYQSVNRVEPSYIRVEADELTYMLHIGLRYELERAIINGEIKPEDVPGEWDKRFEKYFGLKVDKPANGWLQDVHWSHGNVGYFPTYLLGNLAAAQLWETFTEKHPAWATHFRQGDFSQLLNWQRKKVYPFGLVKSLDSAMIDATADTLNPYYWIQYIEEKFGELYNL